MTATEVFAPAKVNLTLHVTGQRADGYHLLDSLVVFADIGDSVAVSDAVDLTLTVTGPMARGVPADDSNLVMKAARLFGAGRGADITLTKRLPAASGIGGGSSDAAATLRALSHLWGLPIPEDLLSLGADVPVCLTPVPTRMRGIGGQLDPVTGLPPCDILLVNPGVEVPTPAVFKVLASRENPPMPEVLPEWRDAQALCDWLKDQRNDLQASAIALQPVIGNVLAMLRETDCLFCAISGSGATCFAIYPTDGHSAKAAKARLFVEAPEFWAVHGTVLTGVS